MQKRFALVIAAFVAALVRVLYSGEELMMWVIFLLAAVSLLALVNLAYTVMFVRISQSVTPAELTCEEFGTFVVRIQNRGALPTAHLELFYDTSETLFRTGELGRAVFTVMSGQTVGLRNPIFFPYRGVFRPSITRVVIYDLFGFFKFTLAPESYADTSGVVVLPKTPPPLLSLEGSDPFTGGGYSGLDEQEPYSVASIREFRPGDPLKKVHWKLSARMEKLQVREFDGVITPRIRLFVDLTAHRLRGESAAAFENCVCANAASICRATLGKATPLNLFAYSSGRADLNGAVPADLPRFLRMLAEVKFNCRYRFFDVIRAELDSGDDSGTVVIVTGDANAELTAYAAKLALRGISVSIVAVAASASVNLDDFRESLSVPAGVEFAVTAPVLVPIPEQTAQPQKEEPAHA